MGMNSAQTVTKRLKAALGIKAGGVRKGAAPSSPKSGVCGADTARCCRPLVAPCQTAALLRGARDNVTNILPKHAAYWKKVGILCRKLKGKGIHTWEGMLGYVQKDKGQPHYELFLKNVSELVSNTPTRISQW